MFLNNNNNKNNHQQTLNNNTVQIPSLNSISKEFEALKCIPIQQETLFNDMFVQYYQCSNNNNRVNLNVKVEITQNLAPIKHLR
ncbi:unnamed protein product [Adineta steineri]|uniref:Uncharacterized protein n=1 Tax=Adineta steineri TaxID=433720 RepID=A0A814RWM3_9BILA|nr:unnamed protein product [Adineta steineri]CAF1491285.1 unnamed protein product [Adineta steineri]